MTENDLTFEEILAIYKEFEKLDTDDDDEDIILPKDFLICKGEIENTIGEIYERGTHGVKRNFETATKYFEKAAKNGNLDAKKMLAKKYYDGRGVEKNDNKAFNLFLEVAEEIEDVESLKTAIEILKKQSPDDNWSINSYFNEIEKVVFIKSAITNPEFLKAVEKLREITDNLKASKTAKENENKKFRQTIENGDIETLEEIFTGDHHGVGAYNLARKRCKKLAENGNIEAMRLLGDTGWHSESTIYWYEKYLEKATDTEKIQQAKYHLAWSYYRNKKYEKAFKLYQELSSVKENDEYTERLAEMYYNGWGVAQDLQKAESLYKQLAKKGSWSAIDKLLKMYLKYDSLTPDFEEILRLYEKNNRFEEIGDMYYNGWGVEVNFQKAFQYYEKHTKEYLWYSNDLIKKMISMLLKGEGVEKNEEKAFELVRGIHYYCNDEELIRYHLIDFYRNLFTFDLDASEIKKIAANDAYINIILAAAYFGEKDAISKVANIGCFLCKNGDKEKGLRLLDIAAKNDCDF